VRGAGSRCEMVLEVMVVAEGRADHEWVSAEGMCAIFIPLLYE